MSEVPDAVTQKPRSRPNSIPPSSLVSNDKKSIERDFNSRHSAAELSNWEKQFNLSDKLKLSEPDVRYPDKRIKVLMINHFRFNDLNQIMFPDSDSSLDPRLGSTEDIKELKDIFEPTSKYNVSICQEDEKDTEIKLTKSKVMEAIKNVVEEMVEYDQLMIIISSHGNIQALAAYDETYDINELLDVLKHENLEGKPKFIILNACRVEEFDKKTKNTKRIDDDYFCELDLEDCFLVYSAYPGKEAYRDTTKGGRLLRSFRIAIRELKAKKEERLLFDFFNDIKRHVSTMPNIDYTQMPIVTSNLSKRLYIGMSENE